MDLAEFLLARVAEDEEAAGAAMPGPWTAVDVDGFVRSATQNEVLLYVEEVHILRHDPARVLAECAAKRAIVELHRPEQRTIGYRGNEPITEWQCTSCGGAGPDEDPGGNLFLDTWHDRAPCDTLRLLAAPYAAHPDYRPEWALTE